MFCGRKIEEKGRTIWRLKSYYNGSKQRDWKRNCFSLAAAGYDVAISLSFESRRSGCGAKGDRKRKYGVRCFVFCAKLEDPGAGVKLFGRSGPEVGRPRFNGEQWGYCFRKYFDMTEETLDFLFLLILKLFADDA